MDISYLIPVRGRQHQVATVLPLLARMLKGEYPRCEIIIVESDVAPQYSLLCQSLGVTYINDRSDGAFHKSRLFNKALGVAKGGLIAPYDIDLIPFNQTARKHLELARSHPDLLVVGFRLMTPHEIPTDIPDDMIKAATLGSENSPTAIRKWLIDGERFGVLPHFDRRRLELINGWDEAYIGWGAEDQDVIERYLQTGVSFVASPDLIYLHLHHLPDQNWSESAYCEANKNIYYNKREKHG